MQQMPHAKPCITPAATRSACKDFVRDRSLAKTRSHGECDSWPACYDMSPPGLVGAHIQHHVGGGVGKAEGMPAEALLRGVIAIADPDSGA